MLARALFLFFTALSAVAPEMAEHVEAAVVGDHYVYVDDEGRVSLWTESNGIPGLQVQSFEGGPFSRGYDADARMLA